VREICKHGLNGRIRNPGPNGYLRLNFTNEYVSRTVFCDVGHLSQSMYLAATGLGLGACTTYALNHSLAEEFLGLDGVDESFLSLSMVGVPQIL